MGRRPCAICRRPRRIDLGEGLGHERRAQAPQPGVEPDMRVEEVVGHGQEPVAWQPISHGQHRPPSAEPFQQRGQSAFEPKPRRHDQIGSRHAPGVGGRRPIRVRIDARGHQAVHLGPVAGDLPHQVREDGRGREDPRLAQRPRRRGRRTARCREQAGQNQRNGKF